MKQTLTLARISSLAILTPLAAALLSLASVPSSAKDEAPKAHPTVADIVKTSSPSDWRDLDPQNTIYVELPAGRVVIELAPHYAPNHVANIKALIHENYFDGLAVMRAQDNYVAQWGDPSEKKPIKSAKKTLKQEFATTIKDDIPFTALPDIDTYAPLVGYSDGLPAARDPHSGRTWLTHCYGMVGVGRDNDADSGGGTDLYVVIGHAPRQLDRNVTLVGRVMQGIDLLSSLPRGTGALGFYEKPEQMIPIKSIRLAADVPQAERSHLEIVRTDTPTFKAIINAARFRGGDWYKESPDHVEVCNVPVPVRVKQDGAAKP
ncbi:MAG TPA: peptidylprolyl isomerase [Burkholderiaceae bacterium]|jgi:peptidylprolyl isomerase